MKRFLAILVVAMLAAFPAHAAKFTASLGAADISAPIQLSPDHFPVAIEVRLSSGATLTYSVQYTFEHPSAHATAALYEANAAWYTLPDMSAQTASNTTLIVVPIQAVRLNVTAYTDGTATFVVMGH